MNTGKRYMKLKGNRKPNPIIITHLDGVEIKSKNTSPELAKEKGGGLLNMMPKGGDARQKRAIKNIFTFLAFMLVFTIIARGTTAAAMPEVSTTTLSTKEIVDSVRGHATVTAGGKKDIKLIDGLTVDEVYASTGQNVEIGESILRLNLADIADKLAREEAKLEELQHKLEVLRQSSPRDSTSITQAQNALAWAQQDYCDTEEKYDKLIKAAEKELEIAKNNAAAFNASAQAFEEDAGNSLLEPELESNPSPTPTPAPTPKPTSPPEPDQGMSEEEARKALDDLKAQKAEALKMSAREIENARQHLISAQTGEAKISQDENNTREQKQIDAEVVELDISKQKALIAELEALKNSSGEVRSTVNGGVVSVPEAGTKTTEASAVSFSDTGVGYEAELNLPESDAEKLQTGGTAEVAYTGGSIYEYPVVEGTIREVGEADENKMCKVKISLPQREWKQGEAVEVRMVREKQVSHSCVPLSAVRSDSESSFVLIVESKQTVLGAQNTLVKVPVTVKLIGDEGAIIEGAVSYEDRIVEQSSRSVSEGDRVREKND